jgi:hypothetical protein
MGFFGVRCAALEKKRAPDSRAIISLRTTMKAYAQSLVSHAARIARVPRLRKLALWAGGAVAFYAVIGILVAPPIARHQLERILGEQLGRKVSIERVRINPFALSASIRGFSLKEPDGSTNAASFEELYANVTLSSLVRFGIVVEAARLSKPYLHVVRNEDKTYSFRDIADKLAAARAPAPAAEPEAPPRFAVYNIEVRDGRIEFDDRPLETQHAVTDLEVGLPFVSSLPRQVDIVVQPHLSLKVNGTPFEIIGETKPFKDTHETTVRIDIDDLQLAKYLEYLPVPLRIRVPSGRLDTRLVLALTATPDDELSTFTLSGSVSLQDLAVQQADGAPLAAVGRLSVDLDSVDLLKQHASVKTVRIEKPEVDVTRFKNGRLNLLAVFPAPPAAGPPAPSAVPAASTATPEESGEAQFTFGIAEIALADGKVRFVDRTPEKPVRFALDNLSLNVKSLGNAPETIAAVRLDCDAGARGKLAYDGSLQLVPLGTEGQVDLSGLRLGAFAPYVEQALNVVVTGGALSTKGRLSVDVPEGKPLRVAYRADVSVVNFASLDKPTSQELLNWKSLMVNGIDFELEPLKVSMGQVTLSDFYSRLIVNADGTLNLQALGKDTGEGGAGAIAPKEPEAGGKPATAQEPAADAGPTAAQEPAAGPAPTAAPPPAAGTESTGTKAPAGGSGPTAKQVRAATARPATQEPPARTGPAAAQEPPSTRYPAGLPPNVRLGKIVLRGGRVNFSDYFVKPNYTVMLTSVGGSVTEMTPDKAGDVELRGRIHQTAPLEIAGKVNALSRDLFVDLKASARDIELSPMSPYAVKYAGYGIEKGKLSLKLAYRVENRKLVAENNIYLDQLTFGERVESPTATSLPVLLAVALLKDRNGVIDVNLPISGSLDDPQFSLGGIIVKVIVNLIVKAVTAPFALLGSLFGGGEELAYLEFAPGSAKLDSDAEAKLKTLAKALEERPGLKLDVGGRIESEVDREALKRADVDRQIKVAKLKDSGKKVADAASLDEVTIEPDEYEKYLTAAYRAAKFKRPRNAIGFLKELPVPEMEQLMLTNAQATDDDLRLLADARAQAAKDWLVETGKIPAERVFIVAPKTGAEGIEDKGKPTRVDFSLK